MVELSSALVIDIETAKATIRDTLAARERAVAALQVCTGDERRVALADVLRVSGAHIEA